MMSFNRGNKNWTQKQKIYYTLISRLAYKDSPTDVSRLRLSHQITAHRRSTRSRQQRANKPAKPWQSQIKINASGTSPQLSLELSLLPSQHLNTHIRGDCMCALHMYSTHTGVVWRKMPGVWPKANCSLTLLICDYGCLYLKWFLISSYSPVLDSINCKDACIWRSCTRTIHYRQAVP